MDQQSDAGSPPVTLTSNVLNWFVDRKQALDDFADMLSGGNPARVLVIEGPGGIGKSWLCTRLQHVAIDQHVATCAIDFVEAFDPLLLVRQIALALGWDRFAALSDTWQEATSPEVRIVVESEVERGGVTFRGPATIHGDVAGGHIIKACTFNVQADPEMRRVWLRRINESFLADLRRLGQRGGAVLLFDGMAQATDEARSWIEHVLLDRVGEGQLPGVRVVMAGEQTLDLPSEWNQLAIRLSLDDLPAHEVRTYLLDKRQLDIAEEAVSAIYEVLGGQPDQLALFVDSGLKTLPEPWPIDRVYEMLVQALRDRVPSQVEKTLRVAAIAEWFDAGLLADLLGPDTDVDQQLALLTGYSFVRSDDRGRVRFSPPVRAPLLKTWTSKPTAYERLNGQAALYFDRRAEQVRDDPHAHAEYARQAVGHWLVSDERTACQRLAVLFQENEAHHLLAACQLALQRAKGVAGLSERTQLWLRYWHGRLAMARDRYACSAGHFDAVLAGTAPGTELHALAGWGRGQAAAAQGEWDQAVDRYEESMRTARALGEDVLAGRIMLAMGDVHLAQARAMGGLIRPGLARRTGWRGIVEAIPAFLVALPFVVYAWAIRRWRFLPPLHHGMNYQNWTLARLLMTAVQWYQDAQRTFASLEQDEFLTDAQQRLAQAYHRLGWWRAAHHLFDEVLDSAPVATNAYRTAQVQRDMADMALGAGRPNEAIAHLEKSRAGFERYRDKRGQYQVQALLGQARLALGEVDRGLALFRESLAGFTALGDRLEVGLALHALRRWMRGAASPEQAAAAEALIVATPLKTYLPRVPDRMATALKTAIAVGLLGLTGGAILTQGQIGLTPAQELFRDLVLVQIVLRLLGRIVLLTWAFAAGSSVAGLLLVLYGARQRLRPERLNRIVTLPDALLEYNYRGQKVRRVPWQDVQAIVSTERILWRTPIPLLSGLRVYGPGNTIHVPATILWYDALKADIAAHLREQERQPVRQDLDVRVLRSPLGACLAAAPLVLLMQRVVGWHVGGLSLPLGAVLVLTPLLMFLGLGLLVAGPYWWLVLYPLWVRHRLAPRSPLPWIAASVGLPLVAAAYAMAYWQPFYPIRNMLNAILFPLGFLLVAGGGLWIATARGWATEPVARGAPIYPRWGRIAAMLGVVVVLALLGLFAWREWIPYLWIYPGIASYERGASTPATAEADYARAIAYCSRGLAINPDLADGYYFRALARRRRGEHQKAIDDLTYLIEARGQKLPHYRYARALSLDVVGERQAACDDIETALATRSWAMSPGTQAQAMKQCQEWKCDCPVPTSERRGR